MSWQDLLSQSCRSMQQLAPYVQADPAELARLEQVAERYPLLINPYYLSLIDFSDPQDPIRLMSIPSLAELEVGGQEDTSGEALHTVLPGLQHKYADTALLLSTDQCAMYCRHCFRKRMVGGKKPEAGGELDAIAGYIMEHPEINNVLITGGDSLLNSNQKLEQYLERFSAIPHVDFIRFGTRVPVTLPQRITEDPELIDILRSWGAVKQLYVVTQFNHGRELTDEARLAVRMLQEAGVQVMNQTVLLRGVNDDPQTLTQLLRGLTAWGVRCYYVFQCRPVRGAGHQFQVPLLEGCDIVSQASQALSGPAGGFRYIMSHPQGKLEILGQLDGKLLLRRHHSEEQSRRGELLRITVSPDQTWLPPLFLTEEGLPAGARGPGRRGVAI